MLIGFLALGDMALWILTHYILDRIFILPPMKAMLQIKLYKET